MVHRDALLNVSVIELDIDLSLVHPVDLEGEDQVRPFERRVAALPDLHLKGALGLRELRLLLLGRVVVGVDELEFVPGVGVVGVGVRDIGKLLDAGFAGPSSSLRRLRKGPRVPWWRA